jgi:hypothetical protein
MADFTKLATYLDSFGPGDPDYDLVCFIKTKISEDIQDRETINNGKEDDLTDNETTMSTPQQQTNSNTEGELMGDAFKELDVLNQMKEEKEEIKIPGKEDEKAESNVDQASVNSFGDNSQNQKQASFFSALQKRIKK